MIKAIIFDFYGVVLAGAGPNRPLLDFIRRDLKLKYKTGILSNAAGDISYLLSPDDYDLFDSIVISYQHGMTKPQKEIYKVAAEKLGILPEQCAFIDDTAVHCDGAKAAGMKAILYEDFEQMKTELKKLLIAGSDN